MIVSATLAAARDEPIRSLESQAFRGIVAAQTQALRREYCADRRARLLRYLADPTLIDGIIPGLSQLPCGVANDRLRALRYDERRLGQIQLGFDSRELYAALVSQRIRCWRALRS